MKGRRLKMHSEESFDILAKQIITLATFTLTQKKTELEQKKHSELSH